MIHLFHSTTGVRLSKDFRLGYEPLQTGVKNRLSMVALVNSLFADTDGPI